MFNYWKNKVQSLVKKMQWYDFSLLKGTVFFFTLFLVGVWPTFAAWTTSIHWGIWFVLGIICAIPLWKKMY